MTETYEYIRYLNTTPLDKLTDIDIDFAINYYSNYDGWRFKIEKRRRALIGKFTEMMSQPLNRNDYDFIEKRLLETFDELETKSTRSIWMARRFKTPSYSSGNSPIFDFNDGDGNFIAGENKIAHRANFVTKIKFNINDIYKKQHRRRWDAQEKPRLQ